MFDELLRELRRLERCVGISISMPIDEEGYFDRRCPDPKCRAEFKVLFEDWKKKVRDEVVFCPICRFQSDSSSWSTPEQHRYITNRATSYLQERIGRAIGKDAREFNRRQPRAGFIQMSMTYRPGPRPVLIPLNASRIMVQKSECESCGCLYASIGAAFFCPACGHNSAISTFDGAVDTVVKTIGSLPAIRDALASDIDPDTAENSIRQIRENSLVKLVSSFQRFAEAKFESLPNSGHFTVRKNLFQNLSESSQLWKDATGKGYDNMLPKSELQDLERFFQQRHLLAHKDGIIDQLYIDKTGDKHYTAGQRLVVHDKDITRLAELVSKLALELSK